MTASSTEGGDDVGVVGCNVGIGSSAGVDSVGVCLVNIGTDVGCVVIGVVLFQLLS